MELSNENFNQDYSGISPTTCDIAFVESVFLKSVMQLNDSYVYDSYQCSQKADNVVNYSFVSEDIAGDVSAVCSPVVMPAMQIQMILQNPL